jgi:membrane complex biogenesis BtpA family protein
MELISLLLSGYRPILGVVHLPALPGSPGAIDLDYAIDYAVREVRKLEDAGLDGVIVENFGGKPYSRRSISRLELTSLTVVVREVVRSTSLIVGVNVLRSSALDALAVAYAAGASFIRVNMYCEPRIAPEGVIEPVARQLESLRRGLSTHISVLADIDVKHSYPLAHRYDPLRAARECIERGSAEALVVTGPATAEPPEPGYVAALASIREQAPLLLGSGVSESNIELYWNLVDGFIVATSLKVGARTANSYSAERLRKLVDRVKRLRRGS